MFRFASIAFSGIFALVLLANLGVSQDSKKDPGDVKKDKKAGPLPAGWKVLNLTAEQKDKIHAIQSDYKLKIKALDDQIKKLRHEEHADMVKVLTDAQREELRKALVPEGDPKKSDDPKKAADDKK